ncbi:amino acid transporter [Russula earlei]|uniref:Amino acid transporter n=1 Tax=Russula earlei TaxID=71964 RepID=A0ACC0UD48_9AGAM|nr:amino acid transporter [Russula earlei]
MTCHNRSHPASVTVVSRPILSVNRMFPFVRHPGVGLSSRPADVTDHENEDPGITSEKTNAKLDSVSTSYIELGERTFEEATAGGMGRHLGVFSCTMLMYPPFPVFSGLFLTRLVSSIGRIIGTGIFSTPSSILKSVGSVGASLLLWVAGFLLSFCGLFVWLEFGSMFPRSGGEKVYLEAIYRRPRYLATVIFSANAIILGFSASNCIVFAQNILVSAGHSADRWVVRGIAIGVIGFTTLLHGFTPRLGVYVMNVLTLFKTFILVFIVVTGWAVLSGNTRVKNPHSNFHHAFAGSSTSSNDVCTSALSRCITCHLLTYIQYATAMFKIIFSYSGWQNVNYVLNDVKNPVRTLKIAGPLGLGITSALYILANISYFAASSKQDILSSGTTVASLFFKNVFGRQAQKALTVFVALSPQNVMTVTFSAARVNQELAKEGIPLPFGNRFWASNWPTKTAPLPGLIVHLIPSVIVIILPPPQVAYPFILDVAGYPEQILNLFIIVGLFYLRWSNPRLARPFKVWLPLAFFFLIADAFLLVAPFIRPANKVGDTPPLPYFLYPLIGIAVMFFGILYWAVWQLVLPYVFKFRLVPRKEVLEDGTVVTANDRDEGNDKEMRKPQRLVDPRVGALFRLKMKYESGSRGNEKHNDRTRARSLTCLGLRTRARVDAATHRITREETGGSDSFEA